MSEFSKGRLDRMRDVLASHVGDRTVPGLVALLARGGEAHAVVLGDQAFGGPPMRCDSLFRISSMTKPVTAVAAMILVEECVLRLDDPVAGLLPELADMRVLSRPDAPVGDTVPARRPITVRDLLDFRLGTGMILDAEAFGYPVYEAAHALGLVGYGPPAPEATLTPDEWLAGLGSLPLVHQPGERWLYNTGSYVLGVLIARATGGSLGAFLRERIFGPLGMADTGFTVPAGDLPRFTTQYGEDGSPMDRPEGSPWARPPAFEDGGAGLVSTADDYLAFARMLLGRGAYGGERILSRASVELMTSGQLTPEQQADAFGGAATWGFGVSIVTRRDTLSSTPGRYGWDGGLGTSWWNDPAEDFTGILLTPRMGYPTLSPVYNDFWTTAYAALT